MPSSTPHEATQAMDKLSLKTKPKAKKQVVADSWEDEDSSASDTETGAATTSSLAPPSNNTVAPKGLSAPPPTPISPAYGTPSDIGNNAPWLASSTEAGAYSYRADRSDDGPRRPEKTDAVARRMIANALGVRAPKQTDEQKAYDRAMREKERKRREEEREAARKKEEEAQKAKAAIWDD